MRLPRQKVSEIDQLLPYQWMKVYSPCAYGNVLVTTVCSNAGTQKVADMNMRRETTELLLCSRSSPGVLFGGRSIKLSCACCLTKTRQNIGFSLRAKRHCTYLVSKYIGNTRWNELLQWLCRAQYDMQLRKTHECRTRQSS